MGTVNKPARGNLRPIPPRVLLLVPAVVSLLVGLWLGLHRLGVVGSTSELRLDAVHGPVLVLGFVGTVIAVERAVALRRAIGYLAPGLLGVGALALLSPLPLLVGQVLMISGTLALGLIYIGVWHRAESIATAVQALGAVLAFEAAVLWTVGLTVPAMLPFLVGFVVLTILGERLELARIAIGLQVERLVLGLSLGLVLAMSLTLIFPGASHSLIGFILIVMVVVMGANDVARRTIRSTGLPRFSAAAILCGYVWIAFAGGLWFYNGEILAGREYDAVVHAVFLGYTVSMILAHAPVIFPAVIRRDVPYTAAMWIPLVLLEISLVLRVVLGDLGGNDTFVRWGGSLNVVAILSFIAVAIGGVFYRRRKGPAPAQQGPPTGVAAAVTDEDPASKPPGPAGTLSLGTRN